MRLSTLSLTSTPPGLRNASYRVVVGNPEGAYLLNARFSNWVAAIPSVQERRSLTQQYPDGWKNQFAAVIKTIAVIAAVLWFNLVQDRLSASRVVRQVDKKNKG